MQTHEERFPCNCLIPWAYTLKASYSSCKSPIANRNLLQARQRLLAVTPRQGEHRFGHQKTRETVPAAPGRFPSPARSAGGPDLKEILILVQDRAVRVVLWGRAL